MGQRTPELKCVSTVRLLRGCLSRQSLSLGRGAPWRTALSEPDLSPNPIRFPFITPKSKTNPSCTAEHSTLAWASSQSGCCLSLCEYLMHMCLHTCYATHAYATCLSHVHCMHLHTHIPHTRICECLHIPIYSYIHHASIQYILLSYRTYMSHICNVIICYTHACRTCLLNTSHNSTYMLYTYMYVVHVYYTHIYIIAHMYVICICV